ncbi:D-tyrosyl-tRNA(Tyr) deacylase [Candidatus Aerophobetes bacterium]|nr:D-tyrosyl-tRNA(Tyr) deacylase [Candidatus Aerophobetes bacterium]
MLAVVQRAGFASCGVEKECVARIQKGLVVFLAVGKNDGWEDARWIANKICNLRVFEDKEGKMNLSVREVGGELLLIPQFTLYGDCRKGYRPSFSSAAPFEKAKFLFEQVFDLILGQGVKAKKGVFGAKMLVEVKNEGPVTLILTTDHLRGQQNG